MMVSTSNGERFVNLLTGVETATRPALAVNLSSSAPSASSGGSGGQVDDPASKEVSSDGWIAHWTSYWVDHIISVIKNLKGVTPWFETDFENVTIDLYRDGKVPKHAPATVSQNDFVATILSRVRRDFRLSFFQDKKGRVYAWCSDASVGPTGPAELADGHTRMHLATTARSNAGDAGIQWLDYWTIYFQHAAFRAIKGDSSAGYFESCIIGSMRRHFTTDARPKGVPFSVSFDQFVHAITTSLRQDRRLAHYADSKGRVYCCFSNTALGPVAPSPLPPGHSRIRSGTDGLTSSHAMAQTTTVQRSVPLDAGLGEHGNHAMQAPHATELPASVAAAAQVDWVSHWTKYWMNKAFAMIKGQGSQQPWSEIDIINSSKHLFNGKSRPDFVPQNISHEQFAQIISQQLRKDGRLVFYQSDKGKVYAWFSDPSLGCTGPAKLPAGHIRLTAVAKAARASEPSLSTPRQMDGTTSSSGVRPQADVSSRAAVASLVDRGQRLVIQDDTYIRQQLRTLLKRLTSQQRNIYFDEYLKYFATRAKYLQETGKLPAGDAVAQQYVKSAETSVLSDPAISALRVGRHASYDLMQALGPKWLAVQLERLSVPSTSAGIPISAPPAPKPASAATSGPQVTAPASRDNPSAATQALPGASPAIAVATYAEISGLAGDSATGGNDGGGSSSTAPETADNDAASDGHDSEADLGDRDGSGNVDDDQDRDLSKPFQKPSDHLRDEAVHGAGLAGGAERTPLPAWDSDTDDEHDAGSDFEDDDEWISSILGGGLQSAAGDGSRASADHRQVSSNRSAAFASAAGIGPATRAAAVEPTLPIATKPHAGSKPNNILPRRPIAPTSSASRTTKPASTPDADPLRHFFFGQRDTTDPALERGCALADGHSSKYFKEAALLGTLDQSYSPSYYDNDGGDCADDGGGYDASAVSASDPSRQVYINTHEPFCIAAIGVQGGGKSHTMACILESCLVPFPELSIVRLRQPMSALVLHYDQNVSSICEATGVISPLQQLTRILAGASPATPAQAASSNSAASAIPSFPPPSRCLPRDKMVVLVSPSYYRQRKAFYGDYCIVKPLLFRWSSLTADHIKRIMRIGNNDNQLYVASMLDLLRQYQRQGMDVSFAAFLTQVTTVCNLKGQEGPLQQRLKLIESLVAESAANASIAAEGGDLYSCVKPGTLVVADMTDPLLSSEEANGIFQVLTEQYRSIPSSTVSGAGKLLCLDEAHKFMRGEAGDGLSEAIVNVARLMRHDGMRLAVSTQSPKALAPELLELVTVAMLHRFHSRDWYQYLQKKLPLHDGAWGQLMSLQPGHALVFASRHRVDMAAGIQPSADADGGDGDRRAVYVSGQQVRSFAVHVRPRITADRGASKLNAPTATNVP